MTIELKPEQERILRQALREGRFGTVDEALDTELKSIASPIAATSRERLAPAEAAALLAIMTGDSLHIYLDSLPPPSERWMQRALGTKQVTAAYLLALAQWNEATLLTFDTKLEALAGSEARTEVLKA